MKCSIMQPNYLPWAGLFNLIYNTDIFVFLNDVQYSKNSLGNRNRYLSSAGPQWITVPVRRVALEQSYRETMCLDESKWRKKHLTTIQCTYARHPYFDDFFPVLEGVIGDTVLNNLADINSHLIMAICRYLGIGKRFVLSSDVKVRDQRSERIYDLCRYFCCDTYLSAGGSKGYMEEDNFFERFDLKVYFQNFVCREYKHNNFSTFVEKLSIIDVIFNVGKEGALDYVSAPI